MGCCCSRSSSESTINNSIRVVHLNGYVEDFMFPVQVSQVTGRSQKHFLCTAAQLLVIGSKPMKPNAILEPGNIYFLIPSSALQADVSPLDLASLVKSSLQKQSPVSHQEVVVLVLYAANTVQAHAQWIEEGEGRLGDPFWIRSGRCRKISARKGGGKKKNGPQVTTPEWCDLRNIALMLSSLSPPPPQMERVTCPRQLTYRKTEDIGILGGAIPTESGNVACTNSEDEGRDKSQKDT
ncbi:hypothetical protein JRO89_XS04G0272900 [Xanthoceras sorbifolium]|uniref:DUF4228 domain-containing protein n=1 Tax=Xanthoceras sorbifolium TaxID=99658 RepID=A0ABQ8I7T6_9ROSI|nr:hypothetical protein JRO89_XS04G0272900 [Xanthoceras sorbifolium]